MLVLIGAGVFAWILPADLAYRYGAGRLAPVVLSGVRGTLWDGHADGVSVLGHDFGELNWRAQKSPLLRGRVVAQVRIKGTDVDAAGQLTRAGDGALEVQDFRFSLPAALLAPASGDRLHGTLSGVVTQATLAHGRLSDTAGTARWSEAGMAGEPALRFSELLAEFASQPDGGIAGTVHDDGKGNVALDGSFTLGFTAFDAVLTLRGRNDDAQTVELLHRVGEPQADGSSQIVVHEPLLKVL